MITVSGKFFIWFETILNLNTVNKTVSDQKGGFKKNAYFVETQP